MNEGVRSQVFGGRRGGPRLVQDLESRLPLGGFRCEAKGGSGSPREPIHAPCFPSRGIGWSSGHLEGGEGRGKEVPFGQGGILFTTSATAG